MNEILKLIEDRELYSYLILTKVYIGTNGRTDEIYQGDLLSDLRKLFGEDFELAKFNTATNFLYSEGYVRYPSATLLTVSGRRYFENFIKESINASENDFELLKTKLSEKIITFLGITSNAVTVIDFFSKLINLK